MFTQSLLNQFACNPNHQFNEVVCFETEGDIEFEVCRENEYLKLRFVPVKSCVLQTKKGNSVTFVEQAYGITFKMGVDEYGYRTFDPTPKKVNTMVLKLIKKIRKVRDDIYFE